MPTLSAKKGEGLLLAYGLTFPEAVEEHPWDHIALKVRKKSFIFMGASSGKDGQFSMTVKLPVSAEMAVTLPYVEPANYGLGKSGWVTLRQKSGENIDLDMLKGWIEQSYRAVAPKTLVKMLDAE